MRFALIIVALLTTTAARAQAKEVTAVDALDRSARLLEGGGEKEKELARQMRNMQVLLMKMNQTSSVKLTPEQNLQFEAIKNKAGEIATDKVVDLVKGVLTKALGKAGDALVKVLTPTELSPCSELPRCDGKPASTDCSRRFIMDTNEKAFSDFLKKDGCAQSLWGGLAK